MIATAPLAPKRTAVLVMGVPADVPAAGDATAALLARARRVGAHVLHVRHLPDGVWLEADDLQTHLGEPVIASRGRSAFEGTALATELAEREVESVVVAGFTFGPGCAATAQEALVRHYRTLVAADAAAAPLEIHERALAAPRRLGAEVLSDATIESLLGEG
jgi:nicotinamidase-related amidase